MKDFIKYFQFQYNAVSGYDSLQPQIFKAIQTKHNAQAQTSNGLSLFGYQNQQLLKINLIIRYIIYGIHLAEGSEISANIERISGRGSSLERPLHTPSSDPAPPSRTQGPLARRCDRLPPIQERTDPRVHPLHGGQVQASQCPIREWLLPLQYVPSTRQGVQLVLLRTVPDEPQLRRGLQRQRDQVQAGAVQRFGERVLQAVQLQELGQRPLLQRDPQRYDKVLPQVASRVLRNMGRSGLLLGLRLHVLELVYLIITRISYSQKIPSRRHVVVVSEGRHERQHPRYHEQHPRPLHLRAHSLDVEHHEQPHRRQQHADGHQVAGEQVVADDVADQERLQEVELVVDFQELLFVFVVLVVVLLVHLLLLLLGFLVLLLEEVVVVRGILALLLMVFLVEPIHQLIIGIFFVFFLVRVFVLLDARLLLLVLGFELRVLYLLQGPEERQAEVPHEQKKEKDLQSEGQPVIPTAQVRAFAHRRWQTLAGCFQQTFKTHGRHFRQIYILNSTRFKYGCSATQLPQQPTPGRNKSCLSEKAAAEGDVRIEWEMGDRVYYYYIQTTISMSNKFWNSPAWTMGHRNAASKKGNNSKINPGPGNYNGSHYGENSTPAWKIGTGSRTKMNNSGQPGPGNYNIASKNTGPKVTISSKHPKGGFGGTSFTPGPGNYNISSQNKPGSGVTIGAKYHTSSLVHEEPGPGAYNNDESFKKTGGKMGTSQRKGITGKNFTPGPGEYTYDKRPYSAGPKYGFGKSVKIYKNDYQPGPGHYDVKSSIKGMEGGCTIAERNRQGEKEYDLSNPGPGYYETFPEKSKSGAKIGKAQRTTFDKGTLPGPGAYEADYREKLALGGKIGTEKRGNLGQTTTPGPGTYEAPSEGKGGITISGYKGKSRMDDTPGPGTYNPDETGTRVRPNSANIGKSQRTQVKKNEMPGPGQYHHHESSNYKFAYTKEPRSKELKKGDPGPGQYDIPSSVPNAPHYLIDPSIYLSSSKA